MKDRPLNVLHISPREAQGGAARSAYRVHKGLKQLGVRSRMLVGFKVTDEEGIAPIWGSLPWRIADRICDKFFESLSLQYLFMPSLFNLVRHRWFQEADIVQLYNIHGGYFAYTALGLITKRRPVVWRLSDMWPMTGHCSYPYECHRWIKGCGHCPILSDYPPLRRDTTSLLWKIKKLVYQNSWFNIVAPSKWMADMVKQSPLLGRFPVHIIPNGIDTGIFRPISKAVAREILRIAHDRRVLLFSAYGVNNPRKGGAFFKEALNCLDSNEISDVTVLIVGMEADKWEENSIFPVKCIGRVDNDMMMAAVYSAADLFVLPSLADNFPSGIVESMACGTPVVSFDIGGIPEAVQHMETGYLAKYKDIEDLAQGIKILLKNPDLRAKMESHCREIAEQKYSLELQARRFERLYREALKK